MSTFVLSEVGDQREEGVRGGVSTYGDEWSGTVMVWCEGSAVDRNRVRWREYADEHGIVSHVCLKVYNT